MLVPPVRLLRRLLARSVASRRIVKNDGTHWYTRHFEHRLLLEPREEKLNPEKKSQNRQTVSLNERNHDASMECHGHRPTEREAEQQEHSGKTHTRRHCYMRAVHLREKLSSSLLNVAIRRHAVDTCFSSNTSNASTRICWVFLSHISGRRHASLRPRLVYPWSCSMCTCPIPVAAVTGCTWREVQNNHNSSELRQSLSFPFSQRFERFSPLFKKLLRRFVQHCHVGAKPVQDTMSTWRWRLPLGSKRHTTWMGEGKNLKVRQNALIHTDRFPVISTFKVHKVSNGILCGKASIRFQEMARHYPWGHWRYVVQQTMRLGQTSGSAKGTEENTRWRQVRPPCERFINAKL